MSCIAMLILTLAVSADPVHDIDRTPHELRQAVHAALRASAPSAHPDPAVAATQLVELFDEVTSNKAMIAADRTRYQGLLKARLKSLAKQLKKQLPEPKPADVRLPADKAGQAVGILAQQAANPQRQGVNNFANPNAGQNRDITSANAQQLIDLIERTIAPTTWERVGGLGSIRYYSPLRVLVVRQTGDIHEQLGGLIGGLNK